VVTLNWLPSAGAHIALAAVFLLAGLSKVLNLGALGQTLGQLGVRRSLARPLAVAIVVAELGAALGLLLLPAAPWPRALVAALTLGFAAAGIAAVASRRSVACTCFGNARSGRLGWRQVWLLPLWLGLAALAQWRPPTWGWRHGLLGLAAVLLGLHAWRLPRELRLWRELRADRLAIGNPSPARIETVVP
jgi:uncharacterized membrane protein YphA (DoxX/SURF4 family)